MTDTASGGALNSTRSLTHTKKKCHNKSVVTQHHSIQMPIDVPARTGRYRGSANLSHIETTMQKVPSINIAIK